MANKANDDVTISVADGSEMRAFVASPPESTGSGLLLFQEALGVNDQLRGVARRIAAEGYLVVVPELFHRFAPGFEHTKLEMDVIMPLIKQLTIEGMVADVRATYEWMTKQRGVARDRICALGFCMGGRATYLANSEVPLAAAVSFYPGGLVPLLDRVPKLHGPHLFIWGGKDRSIPPEQQRTVIDAVRAAGKLFVDVEFSDCDHAFFNEQTERYNRAAAEQAWALATIFLRERLGSAQAR